MQVGEETTRATSVRGKGHGAWGAIGVPVAILAALAGFGFVQQQNRQRHQGDQWGHMSRLQAGNTATRYIARVTGGAAGLLTVSDTMPQQGILFRKDGKKAHLRAWFVTLQGSTAETSRYLVRINAATGQVYAMNALVNNFTETQEDASVPDLLTHREAELKARQCLRGMGIPLAQLTTVRSGDSTTTNDVATCNFVYRRHVPGIGVRTLTVCINRVTALPENVWNPVAAVTAL